VRVQKLTGERKKRSIGHYLDGPNTRHPISVKKQIGYDSDTIDVKKKREERAKIQKHKIKGGRKPARNRADPASRKSKKKKRLASERPKKRWRKETRQTVWTWESQGGWTGMSAYLRESKVQRRSRWKKEGTT